jgi:hypothetical protein
MVYQANDGEPDPTNFNEGDQGVRTGDGPGWPCIGVRGGGIRRRDLSEFQNLWQVQPESPNHPELRNGESDLGVPSGTQVGKCPAGASQAEAPMRELAAFRAAQPRG